jgi:hypothetical protein
MTRIRLVSKGTDPLLYSDRTGYIKLSEARQRAAHLLAGLANSLLKQDPKAEQYAVEMLNSESEFSYLVKTIAEAKQTK